MSELAGQPDIYLTRHNVLQADTGRSNGLIPEFPPAIFEQPRISIEAARRTGIPLEETTYLAIGGGLGSFTWVDHLVVHGVQPEQIVAIGFEGKPYARCKRLCQNSQISDRDRLRSDSGATPDNLWGWPGYAVREMWADIKQGRFRHASRLAWQVFTEPVLAEPFTPRLADVSAAVEREARRIGWARIWRFGRVRAIRKTDDGRYLIAYSQTTMRKRRPRLIIAPYVHLALGYPGLRFLPDLQSYRARTGDFKRFVNAYEAHDHVYDRLGRQGGTVIVRGRGITASRIIQRLYEERLKNPKITVIHLLRSPKPAGARYRHARRLTEHHFELQPFNFPKSCFGGDLLVRLEQADSQERAELIDLWGGITTAGRKEWQAMIDAGLAEGWYQIRFGHLEQVECKNGKLVVTTQSQAGVEEKSHLAADFIIDATGLDTDLEHNPLLKDLVETYELEKNCKGKLQVTDNFELINLANGAGRMYASGMMTLGGPYAPVDSFTGLQYAAQRSIEDLIRRGGPGLQPLNPLRSARQWLRWARGVQP